MVTSACVNLLAEVPRRLGMAVEHGERAGELADAARDPFMRDAGVRVEMPLIDDGGAFLDGAARRARLPA